MGLSRLLLKRRFNRYHVVAAVAGVGAVAALAISRLWDEGGGHHQVTGWQWYLGAGSCLTAGFFIALMSVLSSKVTTRWPHNKNLRVTEMTIASSFIAVVLLVPALFATGEYRAWPSQLSQAWGDSHKRTVLLGISIAMPFGKTLVRSSKYATISHSSAFVFEFVQACASIGASIANIILFDEAWTWGVVASILLMIAAFSAYLRAQAVQNQRKKQKEAREQARIEAMAREWELGAEEAHHNHLHLQQQHHAGRHDSQQLRAADGGPEDAAGIIVAERRLTTAVSSAESGADDDGTDMAHHIVMPSILAEVSAGSSTSERRSMVGGAAEEEEDGGQHPMGHEVKQQQQQPLTLEGIRSDIVDYVHHRGDASSTSGGSGSRSIGRSDGGGGGVYRAGVAPPLGMSTIALKSDYVPPNTSTSTTTATSRRASRPQEYDNADETDDAAAAASIGASGWRSALRNLTFLRPETASTTTSAQRRGVDAAVGNDDGRGKQHNQHGTTASHHWHGITPDADVVYDVHTGRPVASSTSTSECFEAVDRSGWRIRPPPPASSSSAGQHIHPMAPVSEEATSIDMEEARTEQALLFSKQHQQHRNQPAPDQRSSSAADIEYGTITSGPWPGSRGLGLRSKPRAVAAAATGNEVERSVHPSNAGRDDDDADEDDGGDDEAAAYAYEAGDINDGIPAVGDVEDDDDDDDGSNACDGERDTEAGTRESERSATVGRLLTAPHDVQPASQPRSNESARGGTTAGASDSSNATVLPMVSTTITASPNANIAGTGLLTSDDAIDMAALQADLDGILSGSNKNKIRSDEAWS